MRVPTVPIDIEIWSNRIFFKLRPSLWFLVFFVVEIRDLGSRIETCEAKEVPTACRGTVSYCIPKESEHVTQ